MKSNWMSGITTRPLLWIWSTVAVQLAGRVLDGLWHARNEQFEGASEQLEAHWLAWLGVLGTVAVAWLLARAPSTRANRGYLITALGASAYIPIAVWHFIEHANGDDPAAAHALIGLAQAAMFAGVIVATVLERRRSSVGRPRPGPSG